MNIILNTLENICDRGDHCTDTLNYFLFKDAKFARFSLLLKIHKRLCNVPGRPVISNCGYYTENNDFMKKLCSLTNLPGNSLLCTIDVVGLYPNIPHDEGLSALRKRLNERDKKDVSTDTLVELAELVLKNNIFNFNERTLKQKRGTAIGTKFALPCSILFMAELEGKKFEIVDNKPYLWWRYIDDIFFYLGTWGRKVQELCKNPQ